jgi:transposase
VRTRGDRGARSDDPGSGRGTPKRVALPRELPRIDIRHELDSMMCGCGCEMRRIRGKWVCERCETLIQATGPPQVVDKGIPTAGLLAQVLVAMYADHLPRYRQEQILSRAGVCVPRSTLAQWVGACGVKLETPMPVLKPGLKQTHRSYL